MFQRALRISATFFLLSFLSVRTAIAIIPHPDHVVILVLENHDYSEIVGSPAAPYINSLINDPYCALFTQSYALARPSQPNYLQMYSGSTQGVTHNNIPAGVPFTTPNLGAQLLAASKTFVGYSESLPYPGFNGATSGDYARKHNPWANWQGTGTNQTPDSLNQPFTSFPSNYNLLPHISFVVPNQANDMHNGSDPTRITVGDTWVQNNLDAYIQWAKVNNSLFILTFDEDGGGENQRILTFFLGEMVQPGSYSNYIDHYSLLRLLEDMFNLPYAGAAATAVPIDYCWRTCSQPVTITANGPLTFCQGGNVTLTASQGVSYLWSTGATTQSITVTSSGNYTVAITDSLNCTSSPARATVLVNNFISSGNVFLETFGTVTVNTNIPVHESNNGFDNDDLTFSGSGQIRASSPSNGYGGASAAGNIYLTNTAGTNCIISGINTSNLAGLQLSFGIFKSSTTATNSDLDIKVSADGINYTSLSISSLPSGSGTAIWYYRTATGAIPSVPNLRIQFIQKGTATQYRIDDLVLTYTFSSPQIFPAGPTAFCPGQNVVLQASKANSYSWSNGASTQSITVSNPGSYFITETGTNGCTATSSPVSITHLPPPTITSFSPSGGPVGSTVTISGANFNNVISVSFNGIQASFTLVDSSKTTATVPPGSSTGPITVTTPCGSGTGNNFIVVPDFIDLNVRLFIEGIYLGGGQMTSLLSGGWCDSVFIEIHHSSSPYSLVYLSKGVIDINGNGTVPVPGNLFDGNYYVTVYTRNALKAWSAMPVYFTMSTSYDFSSSQSQTYNGQAKDLGDGNFSLYSGDINFDRQIDTGDLQLIQTALSNFFTGYVPHDLNGDFSVESSDFSLMENNSLPLISQQP